MIIERFKSKVLGTIKVEIANFGEKYIKRLNNHRNQLTVNLLDEEDTRILKHNKPLDFNRFK